MASYFNSGQAKEFKPGKTYSSHAYSLKMSISISGSESNSSLAIPTVITDTSESAPKDILVQ